MGKIQRAQSDLMTSGEQDACQMNHIDAGTSNGSDDAELNEHEQELDISERIAKKHRTHIQKKRITSMQVLLQAMWLRYSVYDL